MTPLSSLIELCIAVILPITVAAVAHVAFRKKCLLCVFDSPIATCFGYNKTWRGIIVMTVVTSITFAVVMVRIFGSLPSFDLFLLGALLGISYSLAELPNSFVKRLLNIKPGTSRRGLGALVQYFFDHADSVIGVGLATYYIFRPSLSTLLLLTLIGFAVHALVDCWLCAGRLKTRNQPKVRFIWRQILIALVCKVLFKIVNTSRVTGLENLDIINTTTPFMLAANHRNRFDSYLLAGALPWRYFRQLSPMRYLTADMYMKGCLGTFLQWCGAYSNTTRRGIKTLHRSQEKLERNETVLIYPEGCMTTPLDGEKRGRVGVMWLAREVPDAIIIPFRIESEFRVPIPALLKGGHTFTLHFGKPYRPTEFPEDLQPLVNDLMDTIYAL